jgi:NADPH:quinone reductase-like Zn-dependent oxidoreductase
MSGDVRNLDLSINSGGFSDDGVLQQWKVVNDGNIIETKGTFSAVERAAIPTAAIPAWDAIRDQLDGRFDRKVANWEGGWGAKRLKGQTVLTQGTGGVSCFAIQVCLPYGPFPIHMQKKDIGLIRHRLRPRSEPQ